jgi:hypothetical protein
MSRRDGGKDVDGLHGLLPGRMIASAKVCDSLRFPHAPCALCTARLCGRRSAPRPADGVPALSPPRRLLTVPPSRPCLPMPLVPAGSAPEDCGEFAPPGERRALWAWSRGGRGGERRTRRHSRAAISGGAAQLQPRLAAARLLFPCSAQRRCSAIVPRGRERARARV